MLRFTDKGKTDEKLQREVFSMVQEIKRDGLPKTLDGLQNMFRLYNQVFGQNKKLTNCVYCRKTVADNLEKAVLLLDIQPKKATKTESKKNDSPKKKTTRKTTRKKSTAKSK
jgi:hypothetical protein